MSLVLREAIIAAVDKTVDTSGVQEAAITLAQAIEHLRDVARTLRHTDPEVQQARITRLEYAAATLLLVP
jgi:hypothetical protein